jgi:hypothetical protein
MRPEVPMPPWLFRRATAPARRIGGISVCEPWIPRQSAFCSLSLLHLRRVLQGMGSDIYEGSLWLFFNRLNGHSSDSQAGNKFGDDTATAGRIIKE